MKTVFQEQDGICVVSIRGDVTADHIPPLRKELQARLEEDGVRDFVFDLAESEFVDSEGLETMLWLQEATAEKLGQVRLVGAGENIQKILEITRLASHFDCHADLRDAIKQLR